VNTLGGPAYRLANKRSQIPVNNNKNNQQQENVRAKSQVSLQTVAERLVGLLRHHPNGELGSRLLQEYQYEYGEFPNLEGRKLQDVMLGKLTCKQTLSNILT
jgi:hypothetical protein